MGREPVGFAARTIPGITIPRARFAKAAYAMAVCDNRSVGNDRGWRAFPRRDRRPPLVLQRYRSKQLAIHLARSFDTQGLGVAHERGSGSSQFTIARYLVKSKCIQLVEDVVFICVYLGDLSARAKSASESGLVAGIWA
jgi:hypothetical protein